MEQSELVKKIMDASNKIADKVRRNGQSNYIIMNSTVSDYFRRLDIIESRKDKILKLKKIINNK